MKYVIHDATGRIISEIETAIESAIPVPEDGQSLLEVSSEVGMMTHWIRLPEQEAVPYTLEQAQRRKSRPGFGYRWDEESKSWIDRLQQAERARLLRAKEYPEIGDQLDALWKAIGPMTTQGSEAGQMFQQIQAIKARYTKG